LILAFSVDTKVNAGENGHVRTENWTDQHHHYL